MTYLNAKHSECEACGNDLSEFVYRDFAISHCNICGNPFAVVETYEDPADREFKHHEFLDLA